MNTTQPFLLSLSDAIRHLSDPEAVKAAASRVLGERLAVNRAFYAEVEGDDWIVEGGFARGSAPLAPGRYSAETYGRRVMATYCAGDLIVIRNIRTDPGFSPAERAAHIAIDIFSAVGVPLVKEGILVAILAVHNAEPRDWTEEEIGLVQETAERTWAAVEQARAEAHLRESEARYRLLTESLPQLVWTCLPDGRCDYLSRQWIEYTGIPEAQQLDLDWLEQVIHPDDRERTRDHWLGAVAGHHAYDIEYRIRAANGSFRWFQTRGVPLRNEHGKVVKWFGTCTDIDARKKSEEDLRKSNRDLEEFAYVAAHDLQEPIRMINIYTQRLTRRVASSDVEAHEDAGFIHKGVKRMEQLINDLLDYSRAVHTDGLPIGSVADLSASLESALSVLAIRIQESNAVISAQSMPQVNGDTKQFALVFQNLISNALKYRRPDVPPKVEVSAEQRGEEWIISVQDNGIGFANQYASVIFGLFKRLHKDEYPGTGLGLAICKRIVERYGGRMWATAEIGSGATFSFSLQAADTQ